MSVQRILSNQPHLQIEFENHFRSLVANAPLQDMLKGTLSPSFLSSCFQKTLEHLASYEAVDPTLSTMLWNPLLADTLALHLEVALQAANNKTRVEKTVRKDSKSTSSTKSEKPVDIPAVYMQLDQFLRSNPAPYKTAPVRCDFVGCKFCLGLFDSIKLTKCEGHKPCTSAGWFPHVGKTLWNALRRKHDRNTAFVDTERSVKHDEMQSRAAYNKCARKSTSVDQSIGSRRSVSPSTSTSWASQVDEELEELHDYSPSDTEGVPPRDAEASMDQTPPATSTKKRSPLAQYRVDEDFDLTFKPKRVHF